MSAPDSVLREIGKLRVDVTYEKKKHFNAGDRKEKYHYWMGVPVVVINVLLGSFLVGVLSESSPLWAKWLTAIGALIAASLSAVSTFFNLRKDVEGHRRIGNRYLELSRECDRVLAKHEGDFLNDNQLVECLDRLSERRYQIDRDSESYSTSKADYEKAKVGFRDGEEEYTEEEFDPIQQ